MHCPNSSISIVIEVYNQATEKNFYIQHAAFLKKYLRKLKFGFPTNKVMSTKKNKGIKAPIKQE